MIRNHRFAYVLAALTFGVAAATAPVHAATPSNSDVGVTGSGVPASATWTGSSIAGNPDPVGPPAPSCTSPGCDRTSFTLHAPGRFITTNAIKVTATATFAPDSSGTTADIAILDSNNNVLASTTGSVSPASVTASDVQPGNFVVEVDGDIGDPANTGYAGAVSISSSARVSQPGHLDGGITGSRETVADPFRIGTEPTIAVSPDGTTYEGPIFGFSTTQSFIQRSDNGGQTFNTLGLPPGVGKNTTCGGGGDEDISTDPHNNLYFLDLGGEPHVPAAVSPDHGNTFYSNCVANDVATDPGKPNSFPDRQWLSTDTVHGVEWFIWRDGLVSASTPTDPVAGPVYGEFIESAPLASGAAGPSQLVFTHLCNNGTLGIPCFSDLTVAGNTVTDNSPTSPYKGNTYLAIGRSAGVSVAVINPSSTPKVAEHTAAPGASNVLFPTVAVDTAGNVYEAYTDASSFQVKFTWSKDGGTTWTTPIVVNGAPAAVTIMPWIVAGDAGRVDIVVYGSGNTAAPTTNSGPWSVYMLQSLNANDPTPAFSDWTQAVLTDRPNHVEPVCLSGLGCTTNTGPGGDRELGDFFRVALDASGRAMVSLADGNNQLGQNATPASAAPSFADFVRQATGPSLFSAVGTVPAIPLPTNGVTVGAHNDPIPFASPACPTACSSVDSLNLLSSSATVGAGPDGTDVRIHLVVKNLDPTAAVTAPALATSTFLTRWWFNGKIYFASAEDNASQFRFFSGQAAPVSDGAAIKYAYYPSGGAASGTPAPVTGGNGTIDIQVPASAVGNPTSADTLYSVTSYTTTHVAPTAPTAPTATNYPTDFPQIVDVLPAYNVVPLSVSIPESPWTPMLVVAGVAFLAVGVRRSRRRDLAVAS